MFLTILLNTSYLGLCERPMTETASRRSISGNTRNDAMNWIQHLSVAANSTKIDLSEERRLHMYERADQLMGEGMRPQRPNGKHGLAFGHTTVSEEAGAARVAGPTLESIWGEQCSCMRQLRRSTGLLAAITTLAWR